MIIDWHTHVHSPREQAKPLWKGQCPATIDNVLRLHDEVGLDVSVISNSGHYLKEFTREEAVPASARRTSISPRCATSTRTGSSRSRSRSRAAATTICASSNAR